MSAALRIRRHPNQRQLVAYAESLVDKRTSVSAKLAAHVAACPQCAREVEAIRASLEFSAQADMLEASPDLSAQILLKAQQVRQERQPVIPQRNRMRLALQSLACAASLVLVAGLVFSAALGEPKTFTTAQQKHEPSAPATTAPTPEMLRQAAAEVKTLSAAVEFASHKAQSALEREHRRAVDALGADIDAAMTALERNPGCVRATHIVHANLQRQAETLRSLYVERTL